MAIGGVVVPQASGAQAAASLPCDLYAAGGTANAAPQASFCSGTRCTITKIYDQTTYHNDLPSFWSGYWKGPGPNGSDIGADAMALPVTIGGNPAYGVKVTPGVARIRTPPGSISRSSVPG
ncbi:MAG: non-reducing end alpha-L-arabinofuranosidase [Actinomycetota bacterium]|nr:non-reducing end alpha-L-arabinofuranosidase [Actinomycetota bacterium]